jgi:hypothetical protein
MKNKTAVEWLQEAMTKKMNSKIGPSFLELFVKAKAMEKEQIIKAHFDAQPFSGTMLYNAEQYYKETFL